MNRQYNIFKILVILALIGLSACSVPTTQPESPTQAPATPTVLVQTPASPTTPAETSAPVLEAPVVEEIEIQILESFPVQVNAVLRGTLPDACTIIEDVNQELGGNHFLIRLQIARQPNARCAPQPTPFEQVVPLNVEGLRAGTYTVEAHGKTASFELAVDNVLEVTPEPVVTGTPGAWAPKNIFHSILGPVEAPPGWSVAPCEGEAPALCFSQPGRFMGTSELFLSPLENNPEFKQRTGELGIPPGRADFQNPEAAQQVLQALNGLAEQNLLSFEQDRQGIYPEQGVTFTRFEPEEIQIGQMPGIRYGFAGLYEDGRVLERWLTYAAFDGEVLYFMNAAYDPAYPGSFSSDEDLLSAEPYLREIIANLKLPFQVFETEVNSVTALEAVPILQAPGAQPPVGELGEGQSIPVGGSGVDGQWWRVECPEEVGGGCWITADPQLVQPN